jgi:enamine deaminase RidA (YjgF/YER057c/UK114 family)
MKLPLVHVVHVVRTASPLALILLLAVFFASGRVAAQDAEQRLKDAGIMLPPVPKPAANYVNAVRTGNLLFLAGKGPTKPDGTNITGKLGKDLTVQQGYDAARLTAINQLAVLKAELGSLNKVKRIVKVLGMIQCVPEFTDHSKVMNGFSDLMATVFADAGKHARSSVGMIALPFGIAVEVEMIVEVTD